ncbi:MAG: hypothetical protein ACYDG6_00555 [Thermincolia bacterium]
MEIENEESPEERCSTLRTLTVVFKIVAADFIDIEDNTRRIADYLTNNNINF